jgi:hypothetical protein
MTEEKLKDYLYKIKEFLPFEEGYENESIYVDYPLSTYGHHENLGLIEALKRVAVNNFITLDTSLEYMDPGMSSVMNVVLKYKLDGYINTKILSSEQNSDHQLIRVYIKIKDIVACFDQFATTAV